MTTFQIVMVALGGLLGVSAFWDKIKAAIISIGNIKSPKLPIIVDVGCPDCPIPTDEAWELVETVSQWQHLVEMCDAQQLFEAKAKLEEIFPLLVKKGDIPNENV
jgi:hypothetical protein